ncbi:MAG: PASTA domain-containing protein [Bacteroidales bacterium]|nr:PASTA domain-containing protein [Bacteroidales bacterium]
MFTFLTKKKFYLHLAIILLLSFIIAWAVFKSLDSYTRHGEVYSVPDFRGQYYRTVVEQNKQLFKFVLMDSVYQKGAANGSIIQQDPLPGSRVKQGRNIYYVIVAQTAERVAMPNLRNLSIRQAVVRLENAGLNINELVYVDHFARNAVIEQQYNGEVIEPGTEIFKGSNIDLVLGNGGKGEKTPLPFLVGMRPSQVKAALQRASLNLGNIYYPDSDTAHARAFRTEPATLPGVEIELGTKIDIWFRSEQSIDFEELIIQMQASNISKDSLQQIINNLYQFE